MNATESKVRQGEHEAQNALDDQRAGKAEGRGGRDTVPKERGKKEGQLGKQQNGTKRGGNRGKRGNKAREGGQRVPEGHAE